MDYKENIYDLKYVKRANRLPYSKSLRRLGKQYGDKQFNYSPQPPARDIYFRPGKT